MPDGSVFDKLGLVGLAPSSTKKTWARVQAIHRWRAEGSSAARAPSRRGPPVPTHPAPCRVARRTLGCQDGSGPTGRASRAAIGPARGRRGRDAARAA
jgi:hypothetical protein